MDRFQILKDIAPPPKTKDSLKDSIFIDIDILGEDYPGSLNYLHKNQKHGIIKFSVPIKVIKEHPLWFNDLNNRKLHFHRPGVVSYIRVLDFITWGDGEDGLINYALEGPIE